MRMEVCADGAHVKIEAKVRFDSFKAFVNGCCSAPLKLIFLLIKYCCFSGVEKNLIEQQ